MSRLRDIVKMHVENNAVLYTTDGSSKEALRCGQIKGAYATIDFGTSDNVTKNFELMRQFEPKVILKLVQNVKCWRYFIVKSINFQGPLVNSEFYPGWLSHWEEPFARVNTSDVTKKLDEMLSIGASVNVYMFYGGTNFAFSSGKIIFNTKDSF